jgi:hypothetical protein
MFCVPTEDRKQQLTHVAVDMPGLMYVVEAGTSGIVTSRLEFINLTFCDLAFWFVVFLCFCRPRQYPDVADKWSSSRFRSISST